MQTDPFFPYIQQGDDLNQHRDPDITLTIGRQSASLENLLQYLYITIPINKLLSAVLAFFFFVLLQMNNIKIFGVGHFILNKVLHLSRETTN